MRIQRKYREKIYSGWLEKHLNWVKKKGELDMSRQRQHEPAKKFDGTSDKLRWDLLPVQALEEVVKVYTFGAKKYGNRNWESGMSWSRFFAAAMRHLWAFWGGETYDKETGLPHTAHACWNCLALTQFLFTQSKFDDRIKINRK